MSNSCYNIAIARYGERCAKRSAYGRESGDTGSATIVFEQGVIQNDEELMVCVTALDDEGSMESWCKIATNHPEPQPEDVTFDVSSNHHIQDD
jgi:hypothetical protein